MSQLLRLSAANAKLVKLQKIAGKKVLSFSTLSGTTCPGALLCKAKAVKTPAGKLTVIDGPNTEFRCYSASIEALYPAVYDLCKYNTDLIWSCKTVEEIVDLIEKSLPTKKDYILRWHESGDFSNQLEFDALMKVAQNHPDIIFYAYTKSLPFWVKRLEELKTISNLLLTASFGGRYDELILSYKLRYCRVVKSRLQAKLIGLPVDKSEKFAAIAKLKHTNFALLIHGQMPAKKRANNPSYSRAWQRVKKGEGGYSKEKS